MSESDGTQVLDLAGIGSAMKAIPPSAWQQLVSTACTTFEQLIAPVTATTGGVGRLIHAKFDRLLEEQKVLTAETISSAQAKAGKVRRKVQAPNPKILLQVVEEAADEVDIGIRELWANLLAQEMAGNQVHPEVGRILSRLSSEDAQVLAEIAEKRFKTFSDRLAFALKAALAASPLGLGIGMRREPNSFNHSHLQQLGLIQRLEAEWILTTFGRGFIKSVTAPVASDAALDFKREDT